MFPLASPRGTLRVSGKQNSPFPLKPVIKCLLYISLPSSAEQQLEMTKLCVFWRTQASTANVLYFFLELITGITYLVCASFQIDWRAKQIQIVSKVESKKKCNCFCTQLLPLLRTRLNQELQRSRRDAEDHACRKWSIIFLQTSR